jgi:undecaprenyl-diphosphatase
MGYLQIFLIALVQGITEFLPISSSGHLILLPKIMDWVDQGLEIDIAVHVGTLLAVMLYFHKDVLVIIKGFFDLCLRKKSDGRNLFINLVVGTIPVVIVGVLIKALIENEFRNATLIGVTSIIFGVLLYIADRKPDESSKDVVKMPLKDAFLIGLSQTIALIPGVSRSGITMTFARFLGYSRTHSAKFSLLLSMPTTFAASVLILYEMSETASDARIQDALLSGITAFVIGFLAISIMMKWLKKFSFTPFVVYRVILGFIILAIVF